LVRRKTSRSRVSLLVCAMAFAPLVGLNLLLWMHINAHGRTDVRDAAAHILELVEARLDESMTQLVALGMASKPSCLPDGLAQLSRAAMKATQVSEVSVIDSTGATLCTPNGAPRIVRTVSSAHDTGNRNIKLFAVDLGNDQGPRSVRFVWQFPNGASLAMLLSGEKLMPALVVGRLQADFIARLTLVDGTFVANRLSNQQMASDGKSAFEVQAISDRYPIALTVAVPSEALWRSYRELFIWGNAGGLLLAMLSIAVAIGVARQTEGPVRDIENAIRRGDFIPYYQPLVDIRTGKLRGCEVLVRRRRPDGGIDGPGAFIRLVEATGQIFEITRSLMVQARDELGPAYGPRPELKVSFNLVAEHFDDMTIVSDVQEIFSNGPVRPNQVVLEVTERQPLPNLASARVIIAKLQELGARIALDDVGTGHGGMSYLLKLGADQMKMDKMFVDAIGTERCSSTIIDTLVKLSEDLNMEFVAEGVETFEQIEYLRERGVVAAQGFVFSPPLPGKLYLELIETLHPISGSKKQRKVRKALRGGETEFAA
jgi:sensor c-di-GMP phosphodiesterase-like protein